MLDGSPYQGYLYAYPHKTAYRPLRPARPLREVWAGERHDALSLYLHVPFCEMRCGFCNLFTRSRPPAAQVAAYLDQLEREAKAARAALDAPRFSQVAIGGGTPTYLDAGELERLFDIAATTMDAALGTVPVSVETSPATATPDRLTVLADRGATRVSIGVQSFLDPEAHAAGRPQRRAEVDRALDTIRAAGVPVLNVDLIYGIDGQTLDTWEYSLAEALRWRPEELYLYPLYVRPLTGLGRTRHDRAGWDEQRTALYRYAVARLAAAGYRQESMRQFRLATAPAAVSDFCCQDDGTVGLGCGSRSYTSRLHYSYDYAVGVSQVRAVLDAYLELTEFGYATHGYRLDPAEQRRRWLIKSLLRTGGMDAAAYRSRFGSDHRDDFAELAELVERGWLEPGRTRLTAEGLARSDAIGPWLVSTRVRHAMTEHTPR